MLLTVRQVAERLSISLSATYQIIESKKLMHHRIGVGRGAIRVSEADLMAYHESCRCGPSKQELKPVKVNLGPLRHLRLK
jgi:excisionase family DNA binding protein